MNENYAPAMPEGAEEGILRGMYLFREGERRKASCAYNSSAAAPSCVKSSRPRKCCKTTATSPPMSGASPASMNSPRSADGERHNCCTRNKPRQSYLAQHSSAGKDLQSRQPTTFAPTPNKYGRILTGRTPCSARTVRPQRYAQAIAQALRGQQPLRHPGRAENTGRCWHD